MAVPGAAHDAGGGPAATDWIDRLEAQAPDAVAAWRGIDAGRFISVRREVRRRTGPGSTSAIVPQLASLAEAITTIVRAVPDDVFGLPGGEEDWNVAQTVAHDSHARAGLVHAAALAAGDRWPPDAGRVVPGVPGPPDATRDDLVRGVERSQRVIERAARTILGRETDTCPLDHPLVGRLRCGEWLLFAGVHDLMHIEQLESIARRLAVGSQRGAAR
jgi:hypothetical protein